MSSESVIVLIWAVVSGIVSGLGVVFGYPAIGIFCLAICVIEFGFKTSVVKAFAIWGAVYTLTSGWWLIPALEGWEIPAAIIVALVLGAVTYGPPALLLRSRLFYLWPIAVALMEFGAAKLGFSLAPMGLWSVSNAVGHVTALGSVYFGTVAICGIALVISRLAGGWQMVAISVMAFLLAFFEPDFPETGFSIEGFSTVPDAKDKWSEQGAAQLFVELVRETKSADYADLYVWPENSYTKSFEQADAINEIPAFKAPLLFGMTRYQGPSTSDLVNSAILVTGDKATVSDKVQLVPFYEGGLWPLFVAPLKSGKRQVLSVRDDFRILPLICYEAAFPIDREDAARSDAIVILSAESGFHQEMVRNLMSAHAKARSLETGLPVVRVSDTG